MLCVSEDQGKTWKPVVSRTTPDKRALAFRATQDGEFWFAVQTLDTEGRLYPPVTSAIEPKMRVVVDTTPPTVVLSPGGRRGSLASVRWDVRDNTVLDRNSFVLEFQAPGASDWRQVPVPQPFVPVGKASWDAGTAGPIRVRASVADRVREHATTRRSSCPMAPPRTRHWDGAPRPSRRRWGRSPRPRSTGCRSSPMRGLRRPRRPGPPGLPRPHRIRSMFRGPAPTSAPGGPRPDPGVRPQLIPSPRFNLQYEVADAGPAGPATVELWVTQNAGRTWSPLAQDPDRRPPFPVALGGEGVFGLKLVARSASKLGDSPPEPGESPDYLVEVDSTPPVVKLDPVHAGVGGDTGKIAVAWHASDLHLGSRPVTISVRPEGGGEWRPIGPPVENTGRFSWVVPPSAPPRFYVRVQVADAVGNVGTDETPEGSPVMVDRTRPKGRITRIDPIGPTGSQ